MKQILVISGKGGTGKTVITASFAALARNKVMADCDVDAADLHLILHPETRERHDFRSGKTARIDEQLCAKCGACREVCRFEAIGEGYVIDPVSCEGCGLCSRVCPQQAVRMEENLSGEWYLSDTRYGLLVHAKLGIAEENSGKLVAKVRQAAKEFAEANGSEYVIIDGPPGIGCPVIASLSGVDMAVVVTEPTVSGLHDLQRVLEVAGHFKVPAGVVVNKYDLNVECSDAIKEFCRSRDVPVLGEVPFSREVSGSVVNGVPAVLFCEGDVSKTITAVWEKIR